MESLSSNTTRMESAAVGPRFSETDHQLEKLSPFLFPRPTDDAVRNSSILVIDDDSSLVQLVRKYLSDAGFNHVRTLTNPVEACTTIKETVPDLVLLDIKMQPFNGLEILETMRREERTAHVPVIMITSDSNEAVEVTALNLGANDFLTKPIRASQLNSRVRNTLSVKAYRDKVTEYSIALESDLLNDAVTGVANRRAFDFEIKRRVSGCGRHPSNLGLLMIDIDHFKRINDVYGHLAGDNVLREVAERVVHSVRDMDLVARYGGEEFAAILPDTSEQETLKVAERVRHSIEHHAFVIEGQDVPITVSVGAATFRKCDDANMLTNRADLALYTAKRNGRNRASFHDGAQCVLLNQPRDIDFKETRRTLSLGDNQNLLETAKIAIVDDEPLMIAVVKKHLKDAGFNNIVEVNDPGRAVEIICREQPDLVLLDIRMPRVSGFEILTHLRSGTVASKTPVVIFTSQSDKETKAKALECGASDLLEKPVNPKELVARVRNTLLAKAHVDNLATYSSRLEHEVRLRTGELTESRREAIQRLARAGELRDNQTGKHVLRVGKYAATIAKELGFSEERVVCMEYAAQLHDVGKIGVPDAILHKPGKLEQDEWGVMRLHCIAGLRVLLDIHGEQQDDLSLFDVESALRDEVCSPVMKVAAIVALTHHEKWDGSGYPRGLAGEEIPIEGRITAVADVFDALSTERSYKEPMPLEKCFRILVERRGSHFDPNILDAFLRRQAEIIRIHREFAD
jgi:putative two-component system response regulator